MMCVLYGSQSVGATSTPQGSIACKRCVMVCANFAPQLTSYLLGIAQAAESERGGS